jgi:hypothetical protein
VADGVTATERDRQALCRVEGCRAPRGNHQGKRHAFEAGYAPVDPDILLACSCGNVLRAKDQLAHDDPLSAARSSEWRVIGGAWKCSRCAQRFDERTAKKQDKRQGTFL